MDFLKHPVGIVGIVVLLAAVGWIGFVGPSGNLSSSDGRETLSDGFLWTGYCEDLRKANFDFKPDGSMRPIGYNDRVYPRYQAAYDKMVAADCDPRAAPRGTFPGIKSTGR